MWLACALAACAAAGTACVVLVHVCCGMVAGRCGAHVLAGVEPLAVARLRCGMSQLIGWCVVSMLRRLHALARGEAVWYTGVGEAMLCVLAGLVVCGCGLVWCVRVWGGSALVCVPVRSVRTLIHPSAATRGWCS
jgi:hypothetical protein